MRDRRLLVTAAAGLALVTLAVRHPTANVRLITHDLADPAPHRFRAAVDLGLVGVTFLYTWTVRRLG